MFLCFFAVYFDSSLFVHSRLDLVNVVVRPLLFTKLSLLTKPSQDKEENMKKVARVYSLNRVFH